ncbi:Protein of unknown function [Thermomonospora echinospora]|uniref:Alpha-1,6-mannosyltransferase n=1 Tax=Thermomonospora echinospora TaxID=1992 RepID=A0A1H6CUU8_9ACTN|nr:Protein of unknown function [Thermomonospora echinospora]
MTSPTPMPSDPGRTSPNEPPRPAPAHPAEAGQSERAAPVGANGAGWAEPVEPAGSGEAGRAVSVGRGVRGLGAAGLGGVGAGLVCFLLTALLGPSVMQPVLRGASGQPPYSLDAGASPYVVIGLIAGGVLLGTAGLGLCLYAVQRGWRCSARRLMAAGVLVAAAFAVMPPIGSSDHLNYAAYGRMAVTGHDPYSTRAVDLPGDPVIGAVEEWRHAPSVYGPIATAQEAFASWVGGDSVRLTVFALSVTNALAFVLAGWILYRVCRTPRGRLRAALLWTCNPLMLLHLVAGAHNDTLAIAAAVGALGVFAGASRPLPRALAAGALAGAAAAIKFPAALVGGGPAWTMLRRRGFGGLAGLGAAAATVALAAYSLAGDHAFDQVRRAANSVSLATPWHLLDAAMGVGQHRIVIRIGSLVLLAALIWLLLRALPRDPGRDPDVADGLAVAAALVLAWLLAATYALPWYDGLGWAVLVLLPWSRFDWALLAHTAALSLAYLPARDPRLIGLPDDLTWLVTVLRPDVIPWLLTGVVAWVAVTSIRRPWSRPVPAPGHSPPASAGSPG